MKKYTEKELNEIAVSCADAVWNASGDLESDMISTYKRLLSEVPESEKNEDTKLGCMMTACLDAAVNLSTKTALFALTQVGVLELKDHCDA